MLPVKSQVFELKPCLLTRSFCFVLAGSDISQNLVQVLQKKLDEATLEVVTLTLSRNAMCKLLPEDVQVIVENSYLKNISRLKIALGKSLCSGLLAGNSQLPVALWRVNFDTVSML